MFTLDWLVLFGYNHIRTYVCACKGVHKMKDYKEKFIKLLDKLPASQIEYLYHLACKLFGQTAD